MSTITTTTLTNSLKELYADSFKMRKCVSDLVKEKHQENGIYVISQGMTLSFPHTNTIISNSYGSIVYTTTDNTICIK